MSAKWSVWALLSKRRTSSPQLLRTSIASPSPRPVAWVGLLLLLLAPVWSARAEPPPLRPASQGGLVVVPDHFLRRWDPITVFFAEPVAGVKTGPEDAPRRFITLSPDHPGAYAWIDRQTLQFRPAEPWPALTRITARVGGKKFTLATLMAPPEETLPAAGTTGITSVDSIKLVFPEPVPVESLAKMVRIELRPLPGLRGAESSWLLGDDFEIKSVERKNRADSASYIVWMKRPIGQGKRVIIHFQLALDDARDESFAEIAFSTLEPFRIVSFGCRGQRLPSSPDGTRYGAEQALRCSGDRVLQVEFSSEPKAFSPLEARNLVRISPSLTRIEPELSGRMLEIRGDFAWETAYRITLHPTVLLDGEGRPLDLRGMSEVYAYFPRKPNFLKLAVGNALLERHGPKMIPLEGRGEHRLDLRIHRIDPLDRSFWPFPESPLAIDESARPPGPGEEAQPHRNAFDIGSDALALHIRGLSTPQVSRIVDSPLVRDGSAASFGLDLEGDLAKASGRGRAGTYLVGVRRLDGSKDRAWMRVEVTDLALSTVEGEDEVRFIVTRLSSGAPVAGAKVEIEGPAHSSSGAVWERFGEGTTDPNGVFVWRPNASYGGERSVKRLAVVSGDDLLVIDADRPPQRFENGRFADVGGRGQSSRRTARDTGWLDWTLNDPSTMSTRAPAPQSLCHLFTDRPVYRPGEKVHLKGYLRTRHRGRLAIDDEGGPFELAIEGPSDYSRSVPMTLTPHGSFTFDFDEESPATGAYVARFSVGGTSRLCSATFEIEAYRVPTFEVRLFGDTVVPIDREFRVGLTAGYYAGGPVTGRPVRWRVTQTAIDWKPETKEEGFYYSTDGRYSRRSALAPAPDLSEESETSDEGSAELTINPALDPGAQPRSYIVEATVTGDDDQTVSSTRHIRGVPAFVLGLSVPRSIEHATSVTSKVLVVGPKGEHIGGQEVIVRLIHRIWHSYLRASDFTDGVAKYVTDVVEEKVEERRIVSEKNAVPVNFTLPEPGVYVVEVEARDRLGRAQTVAVDFFAGGSGAVSWAKPEAGELEVKSDKARYSPGEIATFVVKSPFQNARLLVVSEEPDGNTYEWIDVRGGVATKKQRVEARHVPRMPLHFLLLRGRLEGARTMKDGTDLGRPTTLGATAWLEVLPVENIVHVTVEHPEHARPRDVVDVRIKLADGRGKPLAGEVTLWMVDQAVLALGRERSLDPLPAFITPVKTRFLAHDTRNMVLGRLPLVENPGGDGNEGEEESADLLDQVTVRRNFQSVPYWNPAIEVGPNGIATVKVQLHDDLTLFKVRAKAISGADRFGFATSDLSVRLPVQAQPVLPRFVRALDHVEAGALARVVEGPGGPGRAELEVTGARVDAKLSGPRALVLDATRPLKIDIPFDVRSDVRMVRGRPTLPSVSLALAVERRSDKARDAFRIDLPVLLDRDLDRERQMLDLASGRDRLTVPGIERPFREGTLLRSVLLTDEASMVRMATGLDFLREYPYGSTEPKIARARVYLALKDFRARLGSEVEDREISRAVRDALEQIDRAVDSDGLVAAWPGRPGQVWLTAEAVEFMTEALRLDFPIDDGLRRRMLDTLERALRSDYTRFVGGEEYFERVRALRAVVGAGRGGSAYAAELARKAQYFNTETVAGVVEAFSGSGDRSSATVKGLVDRVFGDVVFRLHQGREIFGGLRDRGRARSMQILPSETRTLAEIVRTTQAIEPDRPRLDLLVNALIALGEGDGWGSTNANASALLALARRLDPRTSRKDVPERKVEIRQGQRVDRLVLGPKAPAVNWTTAEAGPIEIRVSGPSRPLVARIDSRWLGSEPGSRAAPLTKGFIVSRRVSRLRPDGDEAERVELTEPGTLLRFAVGALMEERIQVTTSEERHYVAITLPLAAGIEALNPALETSPAEAKPSAGPTLAPSYVERLDDRWVAYYEHLPKGTFDLYVRTRATTPGQYSQPPARAEMMYDASVYGTSAGARVEVDRE